jgi:hypothetical protein
MAGRYRKRSQREKDCRLSARNLGKACRRAIELAVFHWREAQEWRRIDAANHPEPATSPNLIDIWEARSDKDREDAARWAIGAAHYAREAQAAEADRRGQEARGKETREDATERV